MTRSSQGSQPQAYYRLLFSSAVLLNSYRNSAAAVSIASGSQDSKPLRNLLFQASIFMQASPARKKVSKGPPRRQLSRPATGDLHPCSSHVSQITTRHSQAFFSPPAVPTRQARERVGFSRVIREAFRTDRCQVYRIGGKGRH